MTIDLEERIFQKNIPGKYTQWSDHDDNDDEDDGDNVIEWNASSAGSNNSCTESGIVGYYTSDHNPHSSRNTGVKGVLADHRREKDSKIFLEEENQRDRIEMLHRATHGSFLKMGEESISMASEMQKQRMRNSTLDSDAESNNDDDVDVDDDDDDEFLLHYRQKRLSQMLQQHSYPRFGTVTEVESAIQFSELIEETNDSIYLVFHLYDSRIPCCRLMNEHWIQIAQDMDYCKFFRMHVSKVKKTFDPIGFPCVLVYQANVEVANLTPIVDWEQRDRFTVEEIVDILQSCGIEKPFVCR